MTPALEAHKHQSACVHSWAWQAENGVRGRLYVQFKKQDGTLTSLGYYDDVSRAVVNGFEASAAPCRFVDEQLKRYYDWHPIEKIQEFV